MSLAVFMPTTERLRELFDYKSDGHLVAKKHHSRRHAGQIAGYLDRDRGYLFASVDGKVYRLHRLIWIFHHGSIPTDRVIDHIDRVRTNNKIENLRLVTPAENSRNSDRRARSDYPKARPQRAGVYWNRRGVWIVSVHVGTFHSLEEAERARQTVTEKLAA